MIEYITIINQEYHMGNFECYKSGADHVVVNASESRAVVLEKHKPRSYPKSGNIRSNYMQAFLRQIYIIYPFNINTVSYI